METVIKLDRISKEYDGINILNNINLDIKKGSTVGIVGANGSGKSVLFKLICGFTSPDSGQVYIRNEKLGDKVDFPKNVGVFINEPGYISMYSGLDNLKFLAGINNKISNDKIIQTMERVGLNPNNKVKVSNYSLGMKQKLGIAQAIMEDQDILILDEPFNALDYKTYQDIKEIIKELQKEGRTILLTSHNFEDIEQLCDNIYVIDNGNLKIIDEESINIYKKRYIELEKGHRKFYFATAPFYFKFIG